MKRCSSLPLQLVEGAEAKAYYGLAINYGPLRALVDRLLVKETLTGREVIETLDAAGLIRFPDPYVAGFGWSPGGGLLYPGMSEDVRWLCFCCSILVCMASQPKPGSFPGYMHLSGWLPLLARVGRTLPFRGAAV